MRNADDEVELAGQGSARFRERRPEENNANESESGGEPGGRLGHSSEGAGEINLVSARAWIGKSGIPTGERAGGAVWCANSSRRTVGAEEKLVDRVNGFVAAGGDGEVVNPGGDQIWLTSRWQSGLQTHSTWVIVVGVDRAAVAVEREEIKLSVEPGSGGEGIDGGGAKGRRRVDLNAIQIDIARTA